MTPATRHPRSRPVGRTPALLTLLVLVFLLAPPLAATDGDSRYVTLDSLVVNLADPDSARYLQTTVQLETESRSDADQVRDHIPAVRDRLIHVMGGREPSDVRGSEGRESLREEALEELRATLDDLAGAPLIDALYFSDFIIQ
ncbi:flagellar basal body-associated protein FliL [Thioalkalivibrio sp. ALJ24]|uniref:flagellar basal body-associated FliL family protein n=1 Tax=Thioalkalivibrio sp. ALJ24 TaxID=545276 RepID=UPI000365C080|nr:flagellar basal body-associated FliL family protein [Thioalkalivibrio sp. ALJ24]